MSALRASLLSGSVSVALRPAATLTVRLATTVTSFERVPTRTFDAVLISTVPAQGVCVPTHLSASFTRWRLSGLSAVEPNVATLAATSIGGLTTGGCTAGGVVVPPPPPGGGCTSGALKSVAVWKGACAGGASSA